MKQKIDLTNKFFIWAGLTFFGNSYLKKLKFTQNGSINVEPPFLVLSNHCSHAELFAIAKMLYPNLTNTIGAHTQLHKKAFLLKKLGILPKRQFANDVSIVRDSKRILEKGRILTIFPEGKLSVDGTQSPLTPSIAKFVKMMKVPVVLLTFHGSYLHRPRWANSNRNVPLKVDVQTLSKEQIETTSKDELFETIKNALSYDDCAYQRDNDILIDSDDLVEGLNKILYKCPHCQAEFQIVSAKNKLCCLECGSVFTMQPNGLITGKSAKFDSVSSWYRWQQERVEKQVKSNYYFEQNCLVEEIPNKKYKSLGVGNYKHDLNGITLTINNEVLTWQSSSLHTLSFDNDHIYLSTPNNTYRLTFSNTNGELTKENIATEQIFNLLLK